MPHVFISHAEADQAVAIEFARGLEEAGYPTWYYERDSIPGTSYLVQTGQAVAAASAVVLIISNQSMLSHQVTAEVVRAHEARRPFLPVLLGVTHAEFQERQPEWREAVGAAASLQVPAAGAASVVARLIAGLRALDGRPREAPAAAKPPLTASQTYFASSTSTLRWAVPAFAALLLVVMTGPDLLRARFPFLSMTLTPAGKIHGDGDAFQTTPLAVRPRAAKMQVGVKTAVIEPDGISQQSGSSTDDAKKSSGRHYLAGVTFFQKGDYAKAKEEWSLAVRLDPGNADAKASLDRLEKRSQAGP